MTLPVYVALEKVDVRLVEAAKDLYAGPWRPGGLIVGVVSGRRPHGRAGPRLRCRLAGVRASSARSFGGLVGWFLVSESFIRVTFPLSLLGRLRRGRC